MPNLKPPVTTTALALAYRERILAALPAGSAFTPLMTLYLTDNTTPDEIRAAHASEHLHAVKYYPAGATTNSDAGVTALEKTYATLEVMAETGLPLLLHGEVTDSTIDIFDREAVFIKRHLAPLLKRIPNLKIVLEHITTAEGVDFVRSAPATVAGTLTAHHLLMNRNAMFQGGIRPHHYCLPVLKRERHRQATVLARAVQAAGFEWNEKSAHSAAYDAERTADLFCAIVITWQTLRSGADQGADQKV